MSIRTRILLACLTLTMLTGALGMFTLRGEQRLGQLAMRMYDDLFMGVSFFRAAQANFVSLKTLYSASQDGDRPALSGLLSQAAESLDVAIERAASDEARQAATSLRARVAAIADSLDDAVAVHRHLDQGTLDFDRGSEQFAQDGFAFRLLAEEVAHKSEVMSKVAIAASLCAALLITLKLTHSIVPPLRRATTIAKEIAQGNFGNTIRARGSSEIVGLMGALDVMQAALRERRLAAEQIEHMAHHDALTRLANRNAFSKAMAQAVGDGGGTSTFALLLLDLDQFKPVNDILGHAVGDKLLVAVAERLSGLLRGTDTLARLGGDEFAIILPLATPASQTYALLAARIIDHLSDAFIIDGQPIVIGVSVGIAVHPRDGRDTNELLRCADIAMYRAKDEGKNTFCVFETEMDRKLQARLALEQDLRAAIGTDALELHYQPLVGCMSGEVEGYEALLRWKHPTQGPIPPSVFVPLAEETNLILPLGHWVLEMACRAAADWANPVRVAVNLSPAQFRQRNLAELVMDTLARTGLCPERLEIEVTEGILIDDPDRAIQILSTLRAAGVRVSLDDFGTGYSSLSYLRRFPLDKIKIDKSFIDSIASDPQSAAIVQAVISLAHTLGLSVTAEGVEAVEQLRVLEFQRCNQVQGYLLGRPAPDILAKLEKHETALEG